jgi:hypothetical protein
MLTRIDWANETGAGHGCVRLERPGFGAYQMQMQMQMRLQE